METGALGEHLATLFLRRIGRNAQTLNAVGNNFPLDLFDSRNVYEVKAGISSAARSAWHWRATIGQPGKKESRWLARAGKEAKRKWNDRKARAILTRKWRAVQSVGRQLGRSVDGHTIATIINPRKRIVDVYTFRGFHLRIGWTSPEAARGYKGSFKF